MLDLPGAPILPGDTPLPPRFLGNWDQPLLAYKDRDRIIPPAVQPLQLTLSGDQTLTVGGRVVASWRVEEDQMTITRHVDFPTGGTPRLHGPFDERRQLLQAVRAEHPHPYHWAPFMLVGASS